MAALLEAKNVRCGYSGKKEVLRDFDFALNKGDFVGLIGPNGAGKTTLFRVLSGFLKPQSGTIRLNGASIDRLQDRERSRRMAVVPQNVFSPMPFSVRQVVEMGRISRLSRFQGLSKDDKNKVDDSMKALDVFQFADKLFNELSGGERQRVMIATAISQEPELLLLDEPTSQLDIGHAGALMTNLVKLNEEHGITIMIVSHDIQLAARYCRRIVLLRQGKVLGDGPVDQVLKKRIIGETYGCEVEIHEKNGRFFIWTR